MELPPLRLREWRERCGLSQEELADRAGVSRTTVSALERGVTKGIDFLTLARLSTVLDVPPGMLFRDQLSEGSAMHERYAEHNQFMHRWIGRASYLILNERYDFDRDALVWDIGRPASQDDAARRIGELTLERRRLRVTRNVLDDVAPENLAAQLNLVKLGAALQRGDVIVRQNDRGNLVCEPFRVG